MRYAIATVLSQALKGNRGRTRGWCDCEPERDYDVIIVGVGGHGLATACDLAKEHGMSNVAILEKGWIGGGNNGRNTTIIRSNYRLDGNTRFSEHSMKLWEGLPHDLNVNLMVSHRGIDNLFHSTDQMDTHVRRGNVMRGNGIDAERLSRAELQRRIPYRDYSSQARLVDIDRHPSVFPPGRFAQMPVHHMGRRLHHRSAGGTFDL